MRTTQQAEKSVCLCFKDMRAYRDPTADIAIAHVMRKEKKRKRHSGVARYHEPKCTGGKTIRINKAEWFYSRFNRAIKEGNMELKVVYMAPEELKPYKNNAKRHPEEQIEQIKESIKEFGFNDPIAVDKDNVVVEGHGRLIAAMEMGLEKVPVIKLDELTEEQRKAYTLIHNKLTMNSGFDFSALSLELSDLKDTFDMSSFGFEDFELDNTAFDVKDEDFITGTEITKAKDKTVTCPHCGESFEL